MPDRPRLVNPVNGAMISVASRRTVLFAGLTCGATFTLRISRLPDLTEVRNVSSTVWCRGTKPDSDGVGFSEIDFAGLDIGAEYLIEIEVADGAGGTTSTIGGVITITA